jgi:hypothetical protein
MSDSNSQRCFEFRRKIDGVTHRYRPCEFRNGFPAWKREDLDLWLEWSTRHGWVGVNAEGEILCVPWAVALHMQGSEPPAGIWVSRKAEKSYVYDFVYI